MSDSVTNTAVRLSHFGGREGLTIETIAIPRPQDDEVLVRVAAASANPVDHKIREGKYPAYHEKDLPITLGRDLAGTIEAVGARGHYMLSKGDPVFAFIGQDRGAQARFVVVKAVELVAAPTSIDLVHAAGVPLAAITAWQGLFDHGGLRAGQKALIHGGAGGVGHLAIQVAKAKGATVFATASQDDLDFVRDLGADTPIDYKNERFEDIASDIDVVFDLVVRAASRRRGGVTPWRRVRAFPFAWCGQSPRVAFHSSTASTWMRPSVRFWVCRRAWRIGLLQRLFVERRIWRAWRNSLSGLRTRRHHFGVRPASPSTANRPQHSAKFAHRIGLLRDREAVVGVETPAGPPKAGAASRPRR